MYNPEPTLTRFIKYLKAEQLAHSSIQQYCSVVKSFLYKFRTTPERINTQEIIGYLSSIKSPVSRKQSRAAIAKLYTMMGHSQKMNKVPKPKQPKSLPKFLSENEVAKLLDGITNIKHKAILTTIYIGALRISELQNLKVADIRGDIAILNIINSKGAKDRNIPVTFQLIDQLRNYYKQYKPKTYLFEGSTGGQYSQSSIQAILKRALQKSEISTKIKTHGLRHSRATHLLNAGVSIKVIKDFLGHSKLETTEMYLHLSISQMADKIRSVSTPASPAIEPAQSLSIAS